MHSLRHSFAARCVEAEMNPKTLQIILGHSDIMLTMNLYVHTTEEQIISEMKKMAMN
ncbi:MAG: tyrosine-type recombinase/integrase [Lachnospiraceae bacterium]|nr:tyrosine-type recombinase/integrase [Lachnospiraceae bacterium]